MTHNEVNSCPACATDKYRTVIDRATQYYLKGSRCNGRTVRYLKASSLPVFRSGEKDRSRTPHSRSKDSFYREAVSGHYPGTEGICEEVRKEFERNRYPIFGGLSPKWQAAALGRREHIEICSLNTTMID